MNKATDLPGSRIRDSAVPDGTSWSNHAAIHHDQQ
jgi:hypothetical protein